MADFINYEYQDLVDRMTDKLKNANGWGDGYDSSMGQVLIQLVADTTDQLHYMLERRTTESYMYTARTRSAVIAKASERGYHYKRSMGNRGALTINITSPAVANIIIPQFTEFQYDGLTYVSTEQVFIPTGQSNIIVPVVQGVLVNLDITQEELTSSGDFIIESGFDNIDDLAVVINADGFQLMPVWRNVKRAMSFLTATDNFYDIRYGFDGMRIIFGDGNFGRKPIGNIGISYVQVNSQDEALTTLGNEFTTDLPLVDVNGNTYEGAIFNSTSIRNGAAPEDIDSIRKNAATEHNATGRAVTDEDTKYWILDAGIGAIVDVNVTGENEAMTYAYNTNNIYVNYANQGNTELTPAQKTEMRDFLKTLSIANPHFVLQKANELLLSVGLSVKKDRLLDISTADYYQIIKQFLEGYFAIKRGAIGARYEHSDLIRDLYQLQITRNNIVYKLVDFLRLDIDLLLPFTVPVQNSEVLVKLSGETPKINGSTFALLLNNVLFQVPINSTDTNTDILLRMRDRIFATSPYLAEVLVGDSTGTYQETYNNTVGGGLIVGINVPMNENDKMMGQFTIGSNVGTVLVDSPAYNIQHNYNVGYENTAGRRPIIPVAVGTTLSFTAPLDTDVRVYVRTNLNDPSTETLYFTVSNGNFFSDTFENYHSVQLEYVQTSSNNMTVSFNYPLVDSAANTGLRIYTRDGYGTFTASKDVGDIAQFSSVLKNKKLPIIQNGEFVVLPETLTIVDENNNTLYRSTRAGTLISSVNIPSLDGRVNFRTGVVTIPSELINANYFIKFKQDKYQNVQLSENTIARLTPISENILLPNPFSFIEVV